MKKGSQLRLLPAARPLVERLGREFFRTVPTVPGVYFMRDAGERVLYIGQSRNLKQRLGSYRYVAAETHSRRLVKLVHAVEQITYETAASEKEAIERESLLLREVRPKFNRAGTYVRPEWHLHLEEREGQFLLMRTDEWDAAHIGPFKASLQYSFASVLRLLWLIQENVEPPALPRQLLLHRPPAMLAFKRSIYIDEFRAFLRGESDSLLANFASLKSNSMFYSKFIEADCEQAMSFFDRISVN